MELLGVVVRLCGYMWGSDVVEVFSGSGESLRCTQIHTSLIVNQVYTCATTNSTVVADLGIDLFSPPISL
jgi:hypothetical protein